MKRFNDSEIWNKKWFMKLPPKEKLAFLYITGKCDNVGVWDVNTDLANMQIGDKVDWGHLLNNCNLNIVVLTDKKWWLVDFCNFQYGELHASANNKIHQSYIKLLRKHGLWDVYQKLNALESESAEQLTEIELFLQDREQRKQELLNIKKNYHN